MFMEVGLPVVIGSFLSNCFQGGRHVDYITDQVTAKLIEVVKKKNKGGVNIKPFQVSYLVSFLHWGMHYG